ncbi:hypothetical protein RKD49_006078 [Streptomyces glaucescens]|jgi:hypothetical protein
MAPQPDSSYGAGSLQNEDRHVNPLHSHVTCTAAAPTPRHP